MTLKLGELWGKGLDGVVLAQNRMAFGQAEEAQDLLGGGALAQALFGIEWVVP